MRPPRQVERRGFRPGAVGEAARTAQLAHLQPRNGSAQFDYGRSLLSEGRVADGLNALDTALALDPRHAFGLRNLGRDLWGASRRDAAVAMLMHMSKRPGAETALLLDVAGMLNELGQFGAAAGAAFMALDRAPGSGTAYAHIGRALFGLGKHQEALGPSIAAVQALPGDGHAHANLGAVLLSLGQYEQALEFSRRATVLTPAVFQAHVNESLALGALGQLVEAEAAARAALKAAPAHPSVRHNLAAHLLSRGIFSAEAWELYEGRLELTAAARAIARHRRWRGEEIAGKTLLLHAEQGLGDTLQFVRFIPAIAAQRARVVLVVQPELVRLLQGFPGVTSLLAVGDPLPVFDVFCPLLGLPRALALTVRTIPAPIPYISADPVLIDRWQSLVGCDRTCALQVGLAWAGNRMFVNDATRSIDPALLYPLADLPGVQLHSLQKSDEPAPAFLRNQMSGAVDFADTAALLAGLDLVITVDSAVAHLAGAMGKEVWLLSRFMGCWRWLREREDTPWYPTMRIYRQPGHGDWETVIGNVRRDLGTRSASTAKMLAASSAINHSALL